MNVDFLREPELEFGAGRHIDIRFGLMHYGPLDFASALARIIHDVLKTAAVRVTGH